jgi:hypothetical protein
MLRLSVALSCCTSLMAVAAPPTHQRRQDFSADPHWTADRNWIEVEPNPVEQDFGFSATRHAGGAGAGEIGGRIQRSSRPAWYGLQLPQPRSLDEPLRCRGQFVVTETMGMSSLYLGWFNTQTMEVRPRNFLGLMINGEGAGCEVHVSYNTSAGKSDGFRATGVGPRGAAVRDFNLIPRGTVYTFDLAYDPAARDGAGEIGFTLGGEGPFTGGPFRFALSAEQRREGAAFDRFGLVNPQSSGNWMALWLDDLELDGQPLSFDEDPQWDGHQNRERHDDYGLEDAHRFGFSDTDRAGGERGELGGVIFASEGVPAHYADDVGQLSLDDRLAASGRLAIPLYAPDGGAYLGWFSSAGRGYPPKNVVGVLLEGSTSTGPCLRACLATSDPKLAHVAGASAPPIAADGASHTWRIEYDPEAADGRGELTVWLDETKDSFALPEGARQQGAELDRFGLFVYEGGGHQVEVYLDDLEYTARGDDDAP